MQVVVVGLSVSSALLSAVSTTLKKASTAGVPSPTEQRAGALRRFVRATVTHPLWLAGIVADVGGVGLQIVALHRGALALVQPLLISGLLFALLLRHLRDRRISARELAWGLICAGCLAGFLAISGAAGVTQAAQADRGVAALAAAAAGIAVGLCVLLARRAVPPAGRAALLGIAVGAIYATTAALIKSSTAVLTEHGLLALLSSWQLYSVLVIAAAGLLLAQLALQAGPITASLPATATIDPLLSVLIGVTIYDERLHRGPLGGAVLAAVLTLLTVAIIQLGRIDTAVNTETRPR